jgi:hypothetical protein
MRLRIKHFYPLVCDRFGAAVDKPVLRHRVGGTYREQHQHEAGLTVIFALPRRTVLVDDSRSHRSDTLSVSGLSRRAYTHFASSM